MSGGTARIPVTKNSDIKAPSMRTRHVVTTARRPHHIRLAPTHVPEIDNYAGETDPGKLAVVLGAVRALPLSCGRREHVSCRTGDPRGGYDTVVLEPEPRSGLENVTIYCSTYGVARRGRCGLKAWSTAPWWAASALVVFAPIPACAAPTSDAADITRFGTTRSRAGAAASLSGVAYPIMTTGRSRIAISHRQPRRITSAASTCDFINRLWGTQDDGIYLSPMYARIGNPNRPSCTSTRT